jgi:CBS-domain-containing membrane protein
LQGADSAIYALTDFEIDFPITVERGTSIDIALRDMDRLGIHALLVVSCGLSDQNTEVMGLVTAYAIERARRKWGARSRFTGPLGRPTVADVMSPRFCCVIWVANSFRRHPTWRLCGRCTGAARHCMNINDGP